MKAVFVFAAILVASVTSAQTPVARVADDAKVLDRVAEVSKRDLPRDLLRRIVNEDIDLLRGKKPDGTYQYANFERLEASRKSDSYSVQVREDDFQKIEINGEFAYRLVVEVPTRRLLVTRNRPVYIDRVELDYVPQGTSSRKTETVTVETWVQPGEVKPIDLPEIARQVTARVFARAGKEEGYGNIALTLIQARVVDDPNSPYADAVASEKSILKAIDNGDVASIRSLAKRIQQSLASAAGRQPEPATRTVDVVAPRPPSTESRSSALEPTPTVEIYLELQAIEDLLTGTEGERREGLDRLHQLVRRLRPR
jgi:hypothetical protein